MAEKVVVFGAGATGRGHVGLLAWQAGYEVVFVDKKPELVDLLDQSGKYLVKIYGEGCDEVVVSGYRVFNAKDRQAIAEEIIDADLVLTAVFDQNLSDVAITLALAVEACRKRGRKKQMLNCIACENMMDSSTTLGRLVRSNLSNEEDLAFCDQFFGFPDCMISRVVPRPEPDPLVIITEDYNEWTVRRETFKGPKPLNLEALELVDNQTARLERKLFIHNGGHASCGYLGYHRGYRYIHETLNDPIIVENVLGAMDEAGEVVRLKWGFSEQSIEEYKNDLGRRGAIVEMKDEILRVVRDPIRKLSPRERLVAPAKLAEEYGLPRYWIVKAIVAALKYRHPADLQSELLAARLEKEGVQSVLQEICGINPVSPLFDEIIQEWNAWK
jgi:mannitol-1-phosphate 5-dehydrogenase